MLRSGRAAVDRYLQPAGPAATCSGDRRTDGRTDTVSFHRLLCGQCQKSRHAAQRASGRCKFAGVLTSAVLSVSLSRDLAALGRSPKVLYRARLHFPASSSSVPVCAAIKFIGLICVSVGDTACSRELSGALTALHRPTATSKSFNAPAPRRSVFAALYHTRPASTRCRVDFISSSAKMCPAVQRKPSASRHMGVNNLPRVVVTLRRPRDLLIASPTHRAVAPPRHRQQLR